VLRACALVSTRLPLGPPLPIFFFTSCIRQLERLSGPVLIYYAGPGRFPPPLIYGACFDYFQSAFQGLQVSTEKDRHRRSNPSLIRKHDDVHLVRYGAYILAVLQLSFFPRPAAVISDELPPQARSLPPQYPTEGSRPLVSPEISSVFPTLVVRGPRPLTPRVSPLRWSDTSQWSAPVEGDRFPLARFLFATAAASPPLRLPVLPSAFFPGKFPNIK